MSRENVDVVRRTFAAENRRDAPAIYAHVHPDVEMDFSESPFADFAKAHGVDRGRGQVQDTFRDWYAAFDSVTSDLTQLIDLGNQVVSVFTYRGKGRASGVEVEFKDMAGLWTIQQGKVVRIVWLRSREEALAAAGPSE